LMMMVVIPRTKSIKRHKMAGASLVHV
jgi:hypothetical protein